MFRLLILLFFTAVLFTACKKEEIKQIEGIVLWANVGDSNCERFHIELEGELYVPEYLESDFETDSLEVYLTGFLQNGRRYFCEEEKFKVKTIQIDQISLR